MSKFMCPDCKNEFEENQLVEVSFAPGSRQWLCTACAEKVYAEWEQKADAQNDYRMVEIIKIGNQAKDIGEFDLANAAFAVLLDEYINNPSARFDPETGSGLAAEWETQDETGEYVPELYYDLLNLWCFGAPDWTEYRICIPVPILDPNSAMTALKTATIVEREPHDRQGREPVVADEVEFLWTRLIFAAGNEEADYEARKRHGLSVIDRACLNLVDEDELYDHPAMPIINEAGEVTGTEYNPTPRIARIKERLVQGNKIEKFGKTLTGTLYIMTDGNPTYLHPADGYNTAKSIEAMPGTCCEICGKPIARKGDALVTATDVAFHRACLGQPVEDERKPKSYPG